MKKSFLLTIVAVILGFCGAFLRAKQLMSGFETDTGLPLRSGNPYGFALLLLSILVFLFFLIYLAIYRKMIKKCDYRLFFHISTYTQLLIRVFSAFLMFLSAVLGIYLFFLNNSVSLLIIAFLSLIAGVGLVFLTLAQKRNCLADEHMICAAAPVFWVCFLLIYCFREHSANPVIGSFSYELFALTVSMMALFYFSGIFFARPYLVRTFFTSYFSIFMILTAYGGRLLYDILSANALDFFSSTLWFASMASVFLLLIANVNLLNYAWYPKH